MASPDSQMSVGAMTGLPQRRAASPLDILPMTYLPRAPGVLSRAALARFATLLLLTHSFLAGAAAAREISSQRMTPVVRAVKGARDAVVSIRGQKVTTAIATRSDGSDAARKVSGMGTGTIVDERGYILTNYHVIADVAKIEVTLDDGATYTGELIAHDKKADLAILKIPTTKPLSVIRFGTSADLMEGESVIALGNAYGYEQTVTRGVISALKRDVEVCDEQSYDDLIQTDASINPGNSGGPLLNIDGEMIGVNVAVYAKAQGIGFAIPIDQALNVATELLSVERLESKWHGLSTQRQIDPEMCVVVSKVQPASPAFRTGIQPGDQILRVGTTPVTTPLDFERALLDRVAGDPVQVEVRRGQEHVVLDLALTRVCQMMGLTLTEEPATTFEKLNSRYRGGMYVVKVQPGSPAAREGIVPGDILVGMHRWETASTQDIEFILSQSTLSKLDELKFYLLRGEDTLYGHFNVAHATATAQNSARR